MSKYYLVTTTGKCGCKCLTIDKHLRLNFNDDDFVEICGPYKDAPTARRMAVYYFGEGALDESVEI